MGFFCGGSGWVFCVLFCFVDIETGQRSIDKEKEVGVEVDLDVDADVDIDVDVVIEVDVEVDVDRHKDRGRNREISRISGLQRIIFKKIHPLEQDCC